jgi:hypothetical protein
MATALHSIKPVIAEDDGVRERHGVETPTGHCDIREDGNRVLIKTAEYTSYWSSVEVGLTPSRARYIARKLYRLARRVERREIGA